MCQCVCVCVGGGGGGRPGNNLIPRLAHRNLTVLGSVFKSTQREAPRTTVPPLPGYICVTAGLRVRKGSLRRGDAACCVGDATGRVDGFLVVFMGDRKSLPQSPPWYLGGCQRYDD